MLDVADGINGRANWLQSIRNTNLQLYGCEAGVKRRILHPLRLYALEERLCRLHVRCFEAFREGSMNLREDFARFRHAAVVPPEVRHARSSLTLVTKADASRVQCAASHFTRAFRRSTGVSPHQWLTKAYIKTARDLLLHSAELPVQIASMCGFADPDVPFENAIGGYLKLNNGA